MALSPKQQLFVTEYLVDLTAGAAAMRAGYTKHRRSADTLGSRLLQQPDIAAAVADALEQRAARTRINADRVLLELARVAFANQRSVVDWGPGGIILKPSEGLDEDTSAAIAEVSETTGPKSVTTKVKMHDKIKALELLGKHLRLFKDKDEDDGGRGGNITIVLGPDEADL